MLAARVGAGLYTSTLASSSLTVKSLNVDLFIIQVSESGPPHDPRENYDNLNGYGAGASAAAAVAANGGGNCFLIYCYNPINDTASCSNIIYM